MTAIGPVMLAGTDAQNALLTPFVQVAVDLLGIRIKPLTIEVRARANMPRYRDPRPGDSPTDGHAEGYWRGTVRKILIADDVLPRTDLEETIGHELVHVLFDDWLSTAQKATLLSYLDPRPENYSDTMVNGKDYGYPALPEECIAVWGSAALFGFIKPAYASLYKRRIASTIYPVVKTLMLGVLTIPPDPQIVALKAELAKVKTSVAIARNALEGL